MRVNLKCVYVLYFITLLLTLSLTLPARTGAVAPNKLKLDFFQSYDHLYQAAEKFMSAVTAISPPKGFAYSREDLREYHVLLNALYGKKPGYKSLTVKEAGEDAFQKKLAKAMGVSQKKWGLYEKARDLAKITGLSHRELAIYQKGEGMYGVRKLIYSVPNLQHKQWVSWYLMLSGSGNTDVQKLLFIGDGKLQPQLAALRLEYGKRAKTFNMARKALLSFIAAAMKNTGDIRIKNRLAVAAQIYLYIARQAGKVGWLSENRAGFPLENPDPEQYPKAAALAGKLGVDFPDLAFLKRKEGNYGIKSMLKKMKWLGDVEKLIGEVFD